MTTQAIYTAMLASVCIYCASSIDAIHNLGVFPKLEANKEAMVALQEEIHRDLPSQCGLAAEARAKWETEEKPKYRQLDGLLTGFADSVRAATNDHDVVAAAPTMWTRAAALLGNDAAQELIHRAEVSALFGTQETLNETTQE